MKFIPRRQWGARAPDYRYKGNLNTKSTAHWNGPKITIGGRTIWDHSKCASIVRGIQNFHMDTRNWSDIAYNFIECPHGYTFEGRGLNVINGANGTNTGNRTSHAIMCLAGEDNPFPEEEKVGFRECVMYIANKTGAPEGCRGHRDHKATTCPGNARYKWVHEGMPVKSEPSPEPFIPKEEKEDDHMNEPLEIVKGTGSSWFVTDGITKQWIRNRSHAAILCINRDASAETKPKNMSKDELAKMAPFIWPQEAIDSIRTVGPTPGS